MQYDWLDRWQKNEIAFHLKNVNPLLIAHWPQLKLKPKSTIFVPLCGKTLDLLWLASQGHDVIGVELSEIACKAFFIENNLKFNIKKMDHFLCYSNDQISLYCGDFFKLLPQLVPVVHAVYDRAALIALPAKLRQQYVKHLQKLINDDTQMLLISCDSPNQVQGPPFPVNSGEIKELYQDWTIVELERVKNTTIAPHLIAKGYRLLEDVVYLMKYH